MRIELSRSHIDRLLALLATTAFVCGAHASAPKAPPTVLVQTSTPHYGVIAQPEQAYGMIGTAQGSTEAVSLPYPARLVHIYVQNGQSVIRGAPLFVVQADPAALLANKQASTAYRLAKDDLTHTQALFDQSLATRSQLEAARKAVSDAKSALDAQQALGVGNGIVTVSAPADGVVTGFSTVQGSQTQAGAAILLLALHDAGAQNTPNVMLGVDPAAVSRIHVGDLVNVSGLSPLQATTVARGRIVVIGAAIDPQSQQVNVGACVPLTETGLLPGMHVKGLIATQSGKHWIIPRRAVLRDDHGAYVYQVGKDRHAHRVNIEVRIENDNAYGVDGPLDAAQPLIVTGNYELHDGDAVRMQANATVEARQGTAQ